MALEVAKCLKLVAPAGMNADQQTVWLSAAVDALEDIRPQEVAAISAELRRSVTRPAQIVPEIARLVAERRQRSQPAPTVANNPVAREMEIHKEAQARRYAAGHDRLKLGEAWEWERAQRIDAGLAVRPFPKSFTRFELNTLPADLLKMGLSAGFLEYENGALVEAQI